MHSIPLSCTSAPCKLLFLNPGVYRLVQATVGIGTVLPFPPLVVPHPLSFPRGGGGTVTWSTQKFSLRLIVLLCR